MAQHATAQGPELQTELVLNFFFYAKRRHFPNFMVANVAATGLFIVATTAAINLLFPDASMTPSDISLVRSLLWAGAIIPYLLTSGEIKSRFVN
ncbi:MAG TPA: DUF2569 family protein [Terracidiphilus sp.]|nr:DUF2569 family protein [Terracidiphilus sp.]